MPGQPGPPSYSGALAVSCQRGPGSRLWARPPCKDSQAGGLPPEHVGPGRKSSQLTWQAPAPLMRSSGGVVGSTGRLGRQPSSNPQGQARPGHQSCLAPGEQRGEGGDEPREAHPRKMPRHNPVRGWEELGGGGQSGFSLAASGPQIWRPLGGAL